MTLSMLKFMNFFLQAEALACSVYEGVSPFTLVFFLNHSLSRVRGPSL